MNKELYIGELDFNLSCSCNTSFYPYGLIMFGNYHKQCTDKLIGLRVVIANDSEEGKILTEMLQKEINVSEIEDYIFSLILKYKSLSEVKGYIEKQIKESFEKGVEKGRRDKVREIRNVLEMEY